MSVGEIPPDSQEYIYGVTGYCLKGAHTVKKDWTSGMNVMGKPMGRIGHAFLRVREGEMRPSSDIEERKGRKSKKAR